MKILRTDTPFIHFKNAGPYSKDYRMRKHLSHVMLGLYNFFILYIIQHYTNFGILRVLTDEFSILLNIIDPVIKNPNSGPTRFLGTFTVTSFSRAPIEVARKSSPSAAPFEKHYP